MRAEVVRRHPAQQLLAAPADRLEGLGEHRLEGRQFGVHVGVRLLPLRLRVVAALGCVRVGVALVVQARAAAEQLLAAAVDRADGLGEHDLEVRELAVDVVVGLGPDLLGLPAGVRQDPVRFRLGAARDLGVGDQRTALGVRGLDDPLCLAAGVVDHLFPAADELLRLRERAGQRLAHLFELGEQLGAVDHTGGRHGHGPGAADGRDDLVELLLYVHGGSHSLGLGRFLRRTGRL